VINRPAISPIDEPGTTAAAWAAWPGLAALPAADISRWRSAVIVAAHPDDEVLGPGGIVATLAAAGAWLRLIAVTDGEASHHGAGDPAVLARRRMTEREAALRALGAAGAEVIRLGLPDAGLRDREADIARRLATLVAGFDVCLAPWAGDLHADHEAVGRAAGRLGPAGPQVFGYPIWMWHWARPGDPRVPWVDAVQVPLLPVAARAKQAAIGCFASQAEDRPGGRGPVLAPDFLAHFDRDYEVLFPVRCG
jgi:LmbE family N-acetylglucosaminyl deacetylase